MEDKVWIRFFFFTPVRRKKPCNISVQRVSSTSSGSSLLQSTTSSTQAFRSQFTKEFFFRALLDLTPNFLQNGWKTLPRSLHLVPQSWTYYLLLHVASSLITKQSFKDFLVKVLQRLDHVTHDHDRSINNCSSIKASKTASGPSRFKLCYRMPEPRRVITPSVMYFNACWTIFPGPRAAGGEFIMQD